MGLALIISLGLCFLVMAGVAVINIGERKIHSRLTPAQERAFEVDPGPEPLITDDNVQDVINHTIETGVEHPFLTARKAHHLGDVQVTARKNADFDWPEKMPCDCGGTLHLQSIDDGYVCDNELCVTNS